MEKAIAYTIVLHTLTLTQTDKETHRFFFSFVFTTDKVCEMVKLNSLP